MCVRFVLLLCVNLRVDVSAHLRCVYMCPVNSSARGTCYNNVFACLCEFHVRSIRMYAGMVPFPCLGVLLSRLRCCVVLNVCVCV